MTIKFNLCWLVGHTSVDNDSGYGICSCGTYEYYDSADNWNRAGLIYKPIHILRECSYDVKELWNKYFHKCCDCKKLDVAFGKSCGKHDDCVPF